MVAKSLIILLKFLSYLITKCINPLKKVLVLKSKMVIVKVPYLIIYIRGRDWNRSRDSGLRHHVAGVLAERNIFGSAKLPIS
jgi:hypothetical protein